MQLKSVLHKASEVGIGIATITILILAGCGGGSTTAPPSTPDTTAPITTAALSTSGTTDNATTLSVAIDENGTGYYLALPASAIAPTVSEVQAGTSFTMTANTPATPTISGLIFNTAYTLYFVAMDTANNTQSAVQSASVTTLLPAGYNVHGGLTWTSVFTGSTLWVLANDYCANTTISGLTGWRLPTLAELSALPGYDPAWFAVHVWSSDLGPAGGNYHSTYNAYFAGAAQDNELNPNNWLCVR